MNYFLNFFIIMVSALFGFAVAKSFEKPPPSAVTINTITRSAPARIELIGTNGSQFADIEIQPGRSVNWYGIDQISMLAFTTNRDDGSVFIHDWKRTNFGIRIWPGRN